MLKALKYMNHQKSLQRGIVFRAGRSYVAVQWIMMILSYITNQLESNKAFLND